MSRATVLLPEHPIEFRFFHHRRICRINDGAPRCGLPGEAYWMKFIRFAFVSLFALAAVLTARTQSPESYRGMLTARVRAD